MRALDELQQEIQVFNELLDPIANTEVDINDPNWQKKLREAQHPLDEAGIRQAVERATQRLIELFLASSNKERGRIRKLLADNGSFAWSMVVPRSSDPEIAFRDSVLLVVMDDKCDTRDAITGIGALVDEARAKGVEYRPIMKQIAKVAGTTDRYGFGSMRTIIERAVLTRPCEGQSISMKAEKTFLLAAAAGLTPIALSYGVKPDASIPYLFGFAVESDNAKHVFRAVMGLYLGQALFWVMGALKPALTFAALWSVVVFMGGLALGRILSVVLDGVPSPLLLVYLLLEVGFGLVGAILIRKRPE